MWPMFSPPRRRHMWAEFAVGFHVLVFPSPFAFFLFLILLYRAHLRMVRKTSSPCTSHESSAFKKKNSPKRNQEKRMRVL